MGRFLQTDPIGARDDMNLYAYVGGDPLNAVDPMGMEREDSSGGNGGDTDTDKQQNEEVSGACARSNNCQVFRPNGTLGERAAATTQDDPGRADESSADTTASDTSENESDSKGIDEQKPESEEERYKPDPSVVMDTLGAGEKAQRAVDAEAARAEAEARAADARAEGNWNLYYKEMSSANYYLRQYHKEIGQPLNPSDFSQVDNGP